MKRVDWKRLTSSLAGLLLASFALAEIHDCKALEKSALREPSWYLSECLHGVRPGGVPAPRATDITGSTEYVLNLRASGPPNGQSMLTAPVPTLTFTVLGPQTRAIFAMDFDTTATTLWGIDNTTHELGTIDQTTGAFTAGVVVTGIAGTPTITGMKFDPTSSNVYVSVTDGVTSQLYTLNTTTGVATLVGTITGFPVVIEIAISNTGQMYGHDISSDVLLSIDKATAAGTTIGATGFNANFAQGMDFDPVDNTLYAWLYLGGGTNHLVTFDLATGAATIVVTGVNQENEGAIKGVAPASATPVANEIDAPFAGSATNGNRVFDPNESVIMRPTWMNTSGISETFDGTLTNFTGPGDGAGVTYTLGDATGTYGPIPAGGSAQCTDCYGLTLATVTRPIQHWDATVQEALTLPPGLADGGGIGTIWTLHIGGSFADVDPVLDTNPFYPFIETIFHFGVTSGCGDGTSFCPLQGNLRQEMAVFLLKDLLGSGYAPPECTGLFQDVPCPATPEFPYSNFIEDLSTRGITTGCQIGPPALFCPGDGVTRAQMAVFLLKAKLGFDYTPPNCTGLFQDVPCPATPEFPYSNFIEDLFTRGITSGCQIGPPALYCPDNPVTRQEMAVFLSLTFDLALYGPPLI